MDNEQGAAGSRQADSLLTWLHARVRLAPRLLAQAPAPVRQVFDHDWAPVEALLAQARLLPAGLWPFLLSRTGGFVLISPAESRYLAGEAELRGRTVQNVAVISVQDLAANNEQALHVLGHLVDHSLGCGGEPGGLWLSAGGGLRPRWQQAGARLAGLYALGYAVDGIAAAGVEDYLAQSLALYCRDRRRLNRADPQIEKWLRTSLFEERFWE
jgi:hypothetical protein